MIILYDNIYVIPLFHSQRASFIKGSALIPTRSDCSEKNYFDRVTSEINELKKIKKIAKFFGEIGC